jgi:asparagine synthase (glutamine-hydrolysing)
MCGVAGAVALRAHGRPDTARLRRMSCLLAHRGPDADGLWEAPSGRAALAHRRLSVIDLATGDQPMLNDDGQVGVVFNGEIYNYRELRNDLRRQGATFRTESDTEVLLRMYERDGDACVDQLRGMFAFAIWDDRSGQLLLARDRIGKKPLYYVIEDDRLYFASSLRALRDTSDGPWEVDPLALDAFMTLSYVPAPRTIYRGVSKMEAGTLTTVGAGGSSTRCYWDLARDTQPPPETWSDALDQLDDLLGTAVKLRLRSDVPLGVFLSGGVDSSLVTAIAARHSTTPVTTFSIAFDVAAYDESGYAAQVARHLGTDHHVFRARPDLLQTLPELVRHFGEPFADSSALPTWMLARETRNHVTVALGGDGGDEAFGGYDWYRNAARLRRLSGAVPEPVFALASATVDGVLRRAATRWRRAGQVQRGLAMLSVEDTAERYALLRSFIAPADSETLYDGQLEAARRHRRSEPLMLLAGLYETCAGTDLRRMRYVDIGAYLADCLMPKVDVATMAHGLEARAPLLDQEVVRFALSLPDEWLADRGEGKKILRALVSRYLPADLFERPKQGFSVPLKAWFSGSVRDAIASLPTSERLGDSGWFKMAGVASMVRQHMAGIRDHTQRLYSLLVLDEWLRHS